MTTKALYPNIAPSLSLDFANTKALDPRVTFSRASTGRFFDGKTVAKAEENLLANSNSFSNSTYWLLDATTVASATDPAGGSTASRVTATATNAAHAIGGTNTGANAVAYAAGVTLTYSILAKKSTHDFIQIVQGGILGAHANFNIATGTVGSVVGTGLNPSASMTEFPTGSGWYRCVLTFTPNSALAGGILSVALVASNTATRREAFSASGTEAVDIFGAQVEQRSAVTAYTPTTTQPITNYVPVLQSAANNVARFDHNPVTGESLGLLIEEQRTNLLVRSEEFDNASWTKTNATITANTVVAPDGTLTAEKLADTTANSSHSISRTVASLTGAHTFSVYLKAGERTFAMLREFGTTGVRATFNLTTGTIANQPSGSGATIVAVGNGWYRCSITATLTNQSFGAAIFTSTDGTDTQSYTGDGFSGIYIWGAQLEAGAFPTSYIPTVASQVTRSADAASMTGANFSSWYRADEGTLYGEAVTRTNVTIFTAWDGTQNNRVAIASRASGINGSSGFVIYNNTAQTAFTFTHANNNKVALAYANNDVASTLNGAAVQSDTSASIPSTNQAVIGFDGVARVTGWIRKLAYYPKRLADAELQALTQN